jgi:hypothetical protein
MSGILELVVKIEGRELKILIINPFLEDTFPRGACFLENYPLGKITFSPRLIW